MSPYQLVGLQNIGSKSFVLQCSGAMSGAASSGEYNSSFQELFDLNIPLGEKSLVPCLVKVISSDLFCEIYSILPPYVLAHCIPLRS